MLSRTLHQFFNGLLMPGRGWLGVMEIEDGRRAQALEFGIVVPQQNRWDALFASEIEKVQDAVFGQPSR
jgi:hypothetical protein